MAGNSDRIEPQPVPDASPEPARAKSTKQTKAKRVSKKKSPQEQEQEPTLPEKSSELDTPISSVSMETKVSPKLPPVSPKSTGSTKCIYFRNSQQLSRLEALKDLYPRASVSSIVQQLVDGFLDCLEQQAVKSHEVPVITTVYL